MPSTRDTGTRISNMAKGLKPGEKLMELKTLTPLILATSIKAKRMEREDFNGRMGHIMRETL